MAYDDSLLLSAYGWRIVEIRILDVLYARMMNSCPILYHLLWYLLNFPSLGIDEKLQNIK